MLATVIAAPISKCFVVHSTSSYFSISYSICELVESIIGKPCASDSYRNQPYIVIKNAFIETFLEICDVDDKRGNRRATLEPSVPTDRATECEFSVQSSDKFGQFIPKLLAIAMATLTFNTDLARFGSRYVVNAPTSSNGIAVV